MLIMHIVASQCDINCQFCFEENCYKCNRSYRLNYGICEKFGIGTGSIVGIVIGFTIGGTILVLFLLWIIVKCSETKEGAH